MLAIAGPDPWAQIEHELYWEGSIAHTTISGMARIVGVTQQSLSESLEDRQIGSGLAEMLGQQGFEPHRFSSSGIPEMAIANAMHCKKITPMHK